MKDLVLVTGGTGYIGGRLIAELEKAGVPVRVLARRPEALASRVGPSTQVVRGDVLDEPSLDAALEGVHTAYYLVHSMGAADDFAERDRQGADRFGRPRRGPAHRLPRGPGRPRRVPLAAPAQPP
jgi:uncharacterized protein YbjT (DUF2867 family)